jgi:hypothetical protein
MFRAADAVSANQLITYSSDFSCPLNPRRDVLANSGKSRHGAV